MINKFPKHKEIKVIITRCINGKIINLKGKAFDHDGDKFAGIRLESGKVTFEKIGMCGNPKKRNRKLGDKAERRRQDIFIEKLWNLPENKDFWKREYNHD